MTPDKLARIHAASFTQPRPWTSAEFADLLASPRTLLFAAEGGFALIQIAGPEAELLTIAVQPSARQRGTGTQLLAEALAGAKSRNCEEMFLEVVDTNAAALALYKAAGFTQRALRKDYYNGPNGQKSSALVLHKLL